MEFGDISTLITIGVAIFIFLRLRSVLGKRTGYQEPVERHRSAKQENPSNDNVVTLPRKGNDDNQTEKHNAFKSVDAISKKGSKLNNTLREIIRLDPGFDPGQFLQGSKMAYEMIVNAFADGDKKTLKNLLSREVYEGFSSAIKQNKDQGLIVRSSFVGIDDASIRGADLVKNDANIAVRFVSEMISATYDKDDNLVDGDPEQISEVIDIWTFSRNITSKDPNWKLVSTESET